MTALVSFERVFEVLDLRRSVAEKPDAVDAARTAGGRRGRRVLFGYPSADEVSLASLEDNAPGPSPADTRCSTTSRSRPSREHGRPGRAVGRGQDDDHRPGRPALRPDARAPPRQRHRPARRHAAAPCEDRVGVVTQEAHLFHDTIRANLLYASPTPTTAEWAALGPPRSRPLVDPARGPRHVVGDRGTGSPAARSSAWPSPGSCSRPRPRRPRRGDRPPRQRDRGAVQRALDAALADRTVPGDRPPALHRPPCRPDPRGRRRPRSSKRGTHAELLPRAASTPTSTAPSSPGRAASPRRHRRTARPRRGFGSTTSEHLLMTTAARLEEAVPAGKRVVETASSQAGKTTFMLDVSECWATDGTVRRPQRAGVPLAGVRQDSSGPAAIDGIAQQRVEVAAGSARRPRHRPSPSTFEALERSGGLLNRGALGVLQPLLLRLHRLPPPRSTVRRRRGWPRTRTSIHLDELASLRPDRRSSIAVAAGLGLGALGAAAARAPAHRLRAGRRRPGPSPGSAANLRTPNERLSTLTSTFSTRLLAETRDLAVHVRGPGRAGRARRGRGRRRRAGGAHPRAWTRLPDHAGAADRPARAGVADRPGAASSALHEASVSRGVRGNEHDTREVITEIAALRAERAALLGFADHAVVRRGRPARRAPSRRWTRCSGGPRRARPCANARDEAVELEAALHADGHEGPLRAVGLGVLRRAGAQGARFEVDDSRAAALLRAGPRPARRRLPRRRPQLYGITFDRAARPARLPPGRARSSTVNDDDGTPARPVRAATGTPATPSVAARG